MMMAEKRVCFIKISWGVSESVFLFRINYNYGSLSVIQKFFRKAF
jgi:hypothetical protein